MNNSNKIKAILGIASVVYAVIQCLFWLWYFLNGEDPLGTSAAEMISLVVFAPVPVLLFVTGVVLYQLRSETRRTAAKLTAVTAILLVGKVTVAGYWLLQLKGQFLAGLAALLLIVFVIIPSGVFALLFAMIAKSLFWQPNESDAKGP